MTPELIYHGKLRKVIGYAEIRATLVLPDQKKIIENLRGFIDTGATHSGIREDVLVKHGIDINAFPSVQNMGANGNYHCKRINKVGIVLPAAEDELYTGLHYIDTTTMRNGYDILIGNDVLCQCEFIYEGTKGTFTLKYFKKS